jgi:hypothetical protein
VKISRSILAKESTVKNSQVIDLESGNGLLGQLNLREIVDAEGDSLQT